jgi:ribosome-associated heat shock protein Hsp15
MTEEALRADKWLWYARFFKTRSLATRACNNGKLRASGEVVSKAHHKIKPGDILTFHQGRHVRVIKVIALATRRGPASEAQELYEDLKPPSADSRLPRIFGAGTSGPQNPAVRSPGAGRPTKQDRRALDKLRRNS